MTTSRKWLIAFFVLYGAFTGLALIRDSLPDGRLVDILITSLAFISMGPLYMNARTREDTNKPAMRWMTRFSIALFGYIISLFVVLPLMDMTDDQNLRYLIALIPVLPVLYGLIAMIAFLRSMDELQRQIQIESLAISMGVTSMVTMALGFMEVAGLEPIGMIWVFPMLMAFWGIAVFFVSRRYS